MGKITTSHGYFIQPRSHILLEDVLEMVYSTVGFQLDKRRTDDFYVNNITDNELGGKLLVLDYLCFLLKKYILSQ